jgi:hypothetical protein
MSLKLHCIMRPRSLSSDYGRKLVLLLLLLVLVGREAAGDSCVSVSARESVVLD